ncbi:MAG: SprT-like domain-containing protein [Dehalococcoidia bacterium]|jgi:hypothetical protein|nr:SprT-like domain-containing protein [Dehalococcoidia bacterium]|tara:strand:+ start:1291 stop:2061 length:771 start_codon:yes stop_codon:yes gene_type:complete
MSKAVDLFWLLLETADGVDVSTFDLKQLYRKWNDKLFNGELPEVPIVTKDLKNAGAQVKMRRFRSTGEIISQVIEFSSRYKLPPELLDKLMIHEMIHIFLTLTGHPKEQHGARFKKKAKELGNKVGFEIPMKHDITGLVQTNLEKAWRKRGVILIQKTNGRSSLAVFTERFFQKNLVSMIRYVEGTLWFADEIPFTAYFIKVGHKGLFERTEQRKASRFSFSRLRSGTDTDELVSALLKGDIVYRTTKDSQQKVAA